jgi:hypothetical protein
MWLFELFPLFVVLLTLYLMVNLIRYFFFKEESGGKLFNLSDIWIENDKKMETEKWLKARKRVKKGNKNGEV